MSESSINIVNPIRELHHLKGLEVGVGVGRGALIALRQHISLIVLSLLNIARG